MECGVSHADVESSSACVSVHVDFVCQLLWFWCVVLACGFLVWFGVEALLFVVGGAA